MNRPLVAILTLSFTLCAGSLSNAFAKSLPDGARGRGVLRLQGGTLFRDRTYSDGDGWVAGGAFGFGVARDILVMASIEHIDVNLSRPYRESFQPVTLQLEMGAPFQHRITPRVELGAGIYLRSRDRLVWGMTTASAGMTFALSRDEPATWARSGEGATRVASR